MSETSASRASELAGELSGNLPEGVKTVPRGCATGCLTLPFRVLYKSRYAIALLFLSTFSGHEGPTSPHSRPLKFVSTTADVPSASGAREDTEDSSFVEFFLDPSMKKIVRSVTYNAGQLNEAWKSQGLPVIPASWHSYVAVESVLTEEEELEFEKMLGDSLADVRVYDVALQNGEKKRVFILPDGSVMLSQLAYK